VNEAGIRMETAVVRTHETRHEEPLSAGSPLSEAEKHAIVRAEYLPAAHRIGLVTSLLHVGIFFLPPLYLAFVTGCRPTGGRSWRARQPPGA
jgi:hypothetical protein